MPCQPQYTQPTNQRRSTSPDESLKRLVPRPAHLVKPDLQPRDLFARSLLVSRQSRKLGDLRLERFNVLPQLVQPLLLLEHLGNGLGRPNGLGRRRLRARLRDLQRRELVFALANLGAQMLRRARLLERLAVEGSRGGKSRVGRELGELGPQQGVLLCEVRLQRLDVRELVAEILRRRRVLYQDVCERLRVRRRVERYGCCGERVQSFVAVGRQVRFERVEDAGVVGVRLDLPRV
jgi:hypothetical protein